MEESKGQKIIQELQEILSADDANGMVKALIQMNDEDFSMVADSMLELLQNEFNSTEATAIKTIIKQTGMDKSDDIFKAIDELQKLDQDKLNEIGLTQVKRDFIIKLLCLFANFMSENEATAAVVIPIKKDNEDIKLPYYATEGAAAMDLMAAEEVVINPGETKIIKTGIKVEIPEGYAILIQARSGIAARTKLRLANHVGLIDSDYRGEIGLIIENTQPMIKNIYCDEMGKPLAVDYGSSYTVEKGMRLAQMRLVKVEKIQWSEVTTINDTERGEGGYGSTGV